MKYRWNKKYLYWGVTGFLVIAAAIVFLIILINLPEISKYVVTFMSVLSPVLYGFIMAYILSPVATFFEKPCLRRLFYTIRDKKQENFLKKHPGEQPPVSKFPIRKVARISSVCITVILAIAAIVGMVWLILPEMIKSITGLVNNMPQYVEQVSNSVSDLLNNFPNFKDYVLGFTNDLSATLTKWLATDLLPQMNNIWTLISSNVMNIIGVVLNLLLGMVIAVYFLNSKELFAAQAKKITYCLFKTRTANKIIDTTRDVHKSFGQFITGTLINAFIVGAFYIIIMSIFRMNYAILIGVIMGVTCIIPFFGPFIGAIPCTILLLLADPWECLYYFIIMIIIQLFDGNIVSPKILGDSIGLSSFWVILGMLIGQAIFGFAGLIIGIPLFAVIYSVVKRRVANGLKNRNLPDDSYEYWDIHHIDSDTGEPVMFPHPPYMKKNKKHHGIKEFLDKSKDEAEKESAENRKKQDK